MFIIIETHGGPTFAAIVTDENGENKVFDSLEEAQQEADKCQAAIVIAIDKDSNNKEYPLLKLRIKQLLSSLDYGKLTNFQEKCIVLLEKEINN